VKTNLPRLLIVKPIVPYPPDQGTKVVTFDLIRALEGAFEITVLAKVLDDGDVRAASELERWCSRVVTVAPPNKRSFLHRVAFKLWYSLVSVFARRSLKSLYDCPGAFRTAARALSREDFDVVLVEYWQLYPVMEHFPADRVVLLTHDIDLLVNRASALLERRLWHKLAKVRRWMVEQREEVRTYQRSRRILTLTERDAHAARRLSRERAWVDVLPFGLDPSRFEPPPGNVRRREVLFMGTLAAPFNRDALDYFVGSIYPLLDDLGEFDLTVVGGDLPSRHAAIARDPRVTVVGRVPDVRPYLHRAACIVIPLRFGGGLRIRTLESMMAGLPVVCTSVAIAGMDFEAGKHFLLADTPAEFASQTKRMVNDPAEAARIAAAARERVVDLYAAASQAERSRALFETIARQ
jgi:glycosyltransferase involved in cell wall biosynthesis